MTAPTLKHLRALLDAEFADADAPVISTALLLLDVRTGREELRLFTRVAGGDPRHEVCVWRSEGEHGPFATDAIEAIHAHRLRGWRPTKDAFVNGVLSLGTCRPTGQIGWAVNDLDQDQEDGA
ncbi:hypothetical protein [Streptomyces ipomoeae]|uniref:hypothetical protein n=1 Tax=Streptomyces ipomoeae TaxID=103232 RepID=UPI001146EB64|nr:hypothetical protein [Streptomyces ipomoeae]TQE33163.1 hypothetical protein Sipo7851_21975 [Streptomyces ipomoeae]